MEKLRMEAYDRVFRDPKGYVLPVTSNTESTSADQLLLGLSCPSKTPIMDHCSSQIGRQVLRSYSTGNLRGDI